MNIKKILFATDFSHSSDAALSFASTLAAESDALLYISHVGNSTPAYIAGYYGFDPTPGLQEKISKENREQLESIKPTVERVRFEHRYLTGYPEEEIINLAEAEDVDLIVIGSHGRTGLSRLLLGSIAEAVIRRAACPVLTVKQPANKESDKVGDQEHEYMPRIEPISKHSSH